MSFIEQLKRRNLFRVGITYTVAAWLLIQVSDIVFPRIGLPDSAVTPVIALLAIGVFLALVPGRESITQQTVSFGHGPLILPAQER